MRMYLLCAFICAQNRTEATVYRKHSWDPFAMDYKLARVHRHQGYQ